MSSPCFLCFRPQMSSVFAKLTRLAAEVSALAAKRAPLLGATEELRGAQVRAEMRQE